MREARKKIYGIFKFCCLFFATKCEDFLISDDEALFGFFDLDDSFAL